MATWSRNKVDSATLNGGNQYDINSQFALNEMNAIVNGGLYSQDFAEHLSDTPEKVENGGSLNIELIDNIVGGKTYKKFKFSNLKGQTGATGATGPTGDTGPSNTLSIGTVSDGTSASATITGTSPNQTLNFVLPSGIPNQITITSTGTVSQTLNPNVYYKFTNTSITSLTISLGTEISGKLNEYQFEFIASSTPTTLTLPTGINWLNDMIPVIVAEKIYQISIINNLAVFGEY